MLVTIISGIVTDLYNFILGFIEILRVNIEKYLKEILHIRFPRTSGSLLLFLQSSALTLGTSFQLTY
jgi:hypothetical protein